MRRLRSVRKFLSAAWGFRRDVIDTDFASFVEQHARLYEEAEESGDYGAVTEAYYGVMSDLMRRGYGPSWHFFPPEHDGQSLRRAIGAGHEQLVARVGLEPGMRGIDVGSGAGGWLRFMSKRTGADLTGVSIGREEVETANRLHEAAGLAECCRTVQADALSMPFSANTFDGGSAIYSLKYFADPKPVFREVGRVLRPGASLVTYNIVRTSEREPSDDDGGEILRRLVYSTAMPPLLSASEIVAAAEASDLSCIENTDLTGSAPWYHYLELNGPVSWLLQSPVSDASFGALEKVRVLPRGFARFKRTFVDDTLTSLVDGGRRGLLNGSRILVFRKN